MKIIYSILFISLASCTFMKNKNQNKVYRTNFLGYKASDSMDPANLRFAQEYKVLDNMTAKLVEIGASGEYQNDLAEEIDFSDDKKTLKIKLKDVTFSDGSPIRAVDVAKSLKRATILGTPHANIKDLWLGSDKLKSIDQEIEGIKVLSDKELELKLTYPTKELMFFLTLTDLSVLHESQYTKNELKVSDWEKVTSGAYRAGFSDKGFLMLVANDKSYYFQNKMPQKITFESYKGDDVIQRLKDNSLDLGMITFIDYLNNISTIESAKGYSIVTEKTDGLVYMGLNIKSPIFKKAENRQWIQKKILESFKVDKKYEPVATKAVQFFLPNAKGYLQDAKVIEKLSSVNTSKVPEDLKNGITIRTLSGMTYYMPKDLEQTLSQALGIKIKLQTDVHGDKFLEFYKKREFDATVLGVAMSYKVLGEALNLQYLSENPLLLDPTGKIKSLLRDYQKKENTGEEVALIEKILEQMVTDSECVPLYYYASPFFVNKQTLDASNVKFEESIKFHKSKVL